MNTHKAQARSESVNKDVTTFACKLTSAIWLWVVSPMFECVIELMPVCLLLGNGQDCVLTDIYSICVPNWRVSADVECDEKGDTWRG